MYSEYRMESMYSMYGTYSTFKGIFMYAWICLKVIEREHGENEKKKKKMKEKRKWWEDRLPRNDETREWEVSVEVWQ